MKHRSMIGYLIIANLLTNVLSLLINHQLYSGVSYNFSKIQLAPNLLMILAILSIHSVFMERQLLSHMTSIVIRSGSRNQVSVNILKMSFLMAWYQAIIQTIFQLFSNNLTLSEATLSVLVFWISWSLLIIVFDGSNLHFGSALSYLMTLGLYIAGLYIGSELIHTQFRSTINLGLITQFVNFSRFQLTSLGQIILIGIIELGLTTLLLTKFLENYDFLER